MSTLRVYVSKCFIKTIDIKPSEVGIFRLSNVEFWGFSVFLKIFEIKAQKSS